MADGEGGGRSDSGLRTGDGGSTGEDGGEEGLGREGAEESLEVDQERSRLAGACMDADRRRSTPPLRGMSSGWLEACDSTSGKAGPGERAISEQTGFTDLFSQ